MNATHEIIRVGTAKLNRTVTDDGIYPVLVPIGTEHPRISRSEFRAEGPVKTAHDILKEWAESVGGHVMPRFCAPRPEQHVYSREIRDHKLPVRYFLDSRGRTIDSETSQVIR